MNQDFIISGIQQVGLGVENFQQAWKWYIDHFGFDVRVLEDDTVAELMLPYTGNQPQRRHACIALNMQGGGGLEIWQYAERKPQKIDFEIQIGDLGIFCAKLKSANVEKAYRDLKAKGATILGELQQDPTGRPIFYVQDPFGNLFQIVEDAYIFKKESHSIGGIVGASIGVRDIEKALSVYRDILGFDQVVYDKSGEFDDFISLPGGKTAYRRVLLTHSKNRMGAFSKLFGRAYVELVVSLDRPPRKIYENRYWGDPGFIQICFDITYLDKMKVYCESKGFPFTVDSSVKHNAQNSFDMGEAAGRFAYIEDPDGTLIELVETHKIPILKKIGWYLNLRKRNPKRPLPNFILKLLGINRVKF